MCGNQDSCHGSGKESRCCRESEDLGTHREIPEHWDRQRKIEFFKHRIECFQERIEEARQNLAKIESNERS